MVSYSLVTGVYIKYYSSAKIQFPSVSHAQEQFIARLKKDVGVGTGHLYRSGASRTTLEFIESATFQMLYTGSYEEGLMCKILLRFSF